MEQFTSAEAPLCSKAGEKPPQQASISSPPAVGQTIFHHGKEYTTVKEGLAFILVTPGERRTLDTKAHQAKLHGTGTREDGLPQDVFYNEIMQYNRDLSVLAIRAFGEDVLARPKRKRGRVKKGKKNLTKVAQKSGGNEEDEVAESAPKKQLETREGEECAERISKGPANENGPRSQGNEVILTSGDVNGTYASDSTAPVHNDGPDKEHGHTGDSKKRPRGEDEMDSADHGIAAKRAKTRDRTSATSDASKVVSYVLGQVQTLSQQGNNEGGTQSTQKDVSGLDETEVLDEDFIECERSMSRGGSFIEQDSQNIPTAPLKILDALSATGLRALRYAQELPFETSVTANDLSRNATKMIAANVEHNGLGSKINSVTGNAVAHMYQFVGQEGQGGHKTGYDVIDLDPYGTAVPFLDAAVQAARDGGLLCVTCTDTSVFMSNGYPEKAYSLYGGVPLKGSASHEGGLRLVLHAIATAGSRYGIAIEPLLSLSIDYYARVFVRVRRSAADVKFLAGKTMIVYNCDACHSLTPQWMGRNVRSEGKNNTTHWKHTFAQGPSVSQNCQHCGFKTHVSLRSSSLSKLKLFSMD